MHPRPLASITFALLASCTFVDRASTPNEGHAADPSSKRTIATGELVGFSTRHGRSHAWLGVPFAKPPLGELRWRAPQPPTPWSRVREALRFGSACAQFANPFADAPGANPGTVIGNEDCLYLNVYAPRGSAQEAAQRKLPVMVWLHGGGNSIGHAGTYDGSELAARYNLIVVTTNYRLGPLGWFRHPVLVRGLTGDEQSGNWGTLDQIRALEWVRENIAAFGGDPNNVTLFGESAGGTDVFSLLVSPRAAGLFQRAIAESGSTSSVSLVEAEHAIDAEQPGAENSSFEATLHIMFPYIKRSAALERTLALTPDEIVALLRTASTAEIIRAYRKDSFENFGGLLRMPVLLRDGYTLPLDDTPKLLAEGRYNHVPVILGTNRDELKLFLLDDDRLVRRWLKALPFFRDESRYQLTSDFGSRAWKMRAADAPAATMRTIQGPSVYVYRFDWDEEPTVLWSNFAKLLGAAHGMEIPFVFHEFESSRYARLFTDANRKGREALADAMSSYWANFAYTGTPGRGRSGTLPEWQAVDLADGGEKQLIFDTAAGGGVRMDKQVVTKATLLGQLVNDRRLSSRLRCQIFEAMVENATLALSDREASGCSAKDFEALSTD